MNQQQIILESSPVYLLVCLVLALGFAFLLYRAKHPWNRTWNRILFATRAILAFLLMFLLLGPIVRQINNLIEKPLFIVLFDNSASMREATDTVALNSLYEKISSTREVLREKGYEVTVSGLNGEDIEKLSFSGSSTDLNNALKSVANRYEGRKVAGVVLASDGIYNAGISPLYAAYNFPVYTVGVGDTLQRTDVSIKNIAYNKIAYQGNKFPLRVEVAVKNLPAESINVSLLQRGKVLEQ